MNIVFRYYPLYSWFVKLVCKNLLVIGTVHFPREIHLVLPSSHFLTFRILFVLSEESLQPLVVHLFPMFCFGILPFN